MPRQGHDRKDGATTSAGKTFARVKENDASSAAELKAIVAYAESAVIAVCLARAMVARTVSVANAETAHQTAPAMIAARGVAPPWRDWDHDAR
jgi:hypothetical protein